MSYPAAIERIAEREKRPIFFRLCLILFPIGIIIGILYVWRDAYIESISPEISVGRGQIVGSKRLLDIQMKLSQLSMQSEPQRSTNLRYFLEGTLGSDNNAGLVNTHFHLPNHQMQGTWLAFQRQGESRRAGISLFIELPDVNNQRYSQETITKLASTINAVEGLMRIPEAQRDVTLIFHPKGNPLQDLGKGELGELQAHLDLKSGGELYRLSMIEQNNKENNNPSGLDPATAQGDGPYNQAPAILKVQDAQLLITPNSIHPTEQTTQALHEWLKERTQ